MTRYKLTIEYDGSDFSGWQIQPDSRTVEEEIEKAFSKIFQKPIDIIGQGRTDSGVHAKAQVAHLDLPDVVDPEKLCFRINKLVGSEIQIHSIEKIHSEFHARFDAISREYEYSVLTRPSPLRDKRAWWPNGEFEVQRIKECAELLEGEFDFKGFSKFNEENYTTLCTIFLSEWEELEGRLVYKVRANRFLRNMVRRLVGTMIEVGKGKMKVSEFKEILEIPNSMKRTVTAPAKGLILSKVFY